MTTDFWNRVLAEYDAGDPGDFTLCGTSPTFYSVYHGEGARAAISTLAGQFLANTDAGQHFTRGHTYLFVLQHRLVVTDDELRTQLRAVRRDFLLWAVDNDRNDNTTA
jgi:hypothetical protein